jgi:hypothetical protein
MTRQALTSRIEIHRKQNDRIGCAPRTNSVNAGTSAFQIAWGGGATTDSRWASSSAERLRLLSDTPRICVRSCAIRAERAFSQLPLGACGKTIRSTALFIASPGQRNYQSCGIGLHAFGQTRLKHRHRGTRQCHCHDNLRQQCHAQRQKYR